MDEKILVFPADMKMADTVAEVLSDSFLREKVTGFAVDNSKSRVIATRRFFYRHLARWHIGNGQPALVAFCAGEQAGAAFVSSPRPGLPASGRKRIRLPGPLLLLGFLGILAGLNYRRMLPLSRAMRLPRGRRPRRPHHVLKAIGVLPAFQGRGAGRALLAEVTRGADSCRESSGIYLVTGEEKNCAFYWKAGFQTIHAAPCGEITVWHMFRENRRPGQERAV